MGIQLVVNVTMSLCSILSCLVVLSLALSVSYGFQGGYGGYGGFGGYGGYKTSGIYSGSYFPGYGGYAGQGRLRNFKFNPYLAYNVYDPYQGYGENDPFEAQIVSSRFGYEKGNIPAANPRHQVKSYTDDEKFVPLHPSSPYDKFGNKKTTYSGSDSHKVKRSLGGNMYRTKLMGTRRLYNLMGYTYPGFALSPHYSYSKAGYYNYLNKRNRGWQGFGNKYGSRYGNTYGNMYGNMGYGNEYGNMYGNMATGSTSMGYGNMNNAVWGGGVVPPATPTPTGSTVTPSTMTGSTMTGSTNSASTTTTSTAGWA